MFKYSKKRSASLDALLNMVMRKNYFKFSSLALIAGMCVIASCDNDDDPIVNPDDSSTLHGAVTSDLTLESGKTYTLDGELIVKAGGTKS